MIGGDQHKQKNELSCRVQILYIPLGVFQVGIFEMIPETTNFCEIKYLVCVLWQEARVVAGQ